MNKRICSLALAAAMALTLTACSGEKDGGDGSRQQPPAGVAVQVTEVTAGDIAVENRVSGKVAADSETSIMVASAAKCIEVYVQAGDTVKAGDRICKLDLASTQSNYNAASISYQSAVDSYNAQKAILDKQLALAETNLANTKALYEIGAASRLEIDQAELAVAQAKAGRTSALAQLEAGMQSYKANVQQLSGVMDNVDREGNVIAPVDGTLVSLSAVENGYVSNTMPVAVIDGVDQMKITVSVSEALVPKLAIGDEVDVTVASAGVSFTGTIRSVEKTANVQTKLYAVVVSVPADVSGLMSGMFAEVSFRTDASADTIVIPTEAILTANGRQYVYVVEGDAARYVEITVGLTGTGVTEVVSGLTAGQKLVVVGQSYLTDGDAVRVVSGEG